MARVFEPAAPIRLAVSEGSALGVLQAAVLALHHVLVGREEGGEVASPQVPVHQQTAWSRSNYISSSCNICRLVELVFLSVIKYDDASIKRKVFVVFF